ncbi:Outer membrane receptor proteins, mostly Fe transport [Reichenbachiella faecimaris]|uniref:Outer membrane receptor proteins, mostly Fe transport n=1 Tax=Reichenbachiella faecimaris TaxID=692418 RepID=A0A1W2G869_REIFA|nr:outer membrane beta-barrel family protein [Reichenbachiella faecimaris]SMD32880.1 Outer membrane receptor proteins, mostly Fe transport [Reichenbachiella faecimaris]
MIRSTVVAILILSSLALRAQTRTQIVGKVVESESNKPVEFATVAVIDLRTKKPITGATTSLEGAFAISTSETAFEIEISFIGFEKKIISDFQVVNNRVDLGTISIKSDSKQLEEIVVEGEKSQTEFRIDKRVFNVGSDLSAAGASALDVLTNVPSVNVNIEGQISLRGSTGVQILIDGKPSILTASNDGNALGSITADMIESVEVITNPSAKYEAEGTSGIINIVLKKEEKKGTNGSISINTGVPHNHSIGFSLNHRTEKFNLFSQFGVGYRELPRDKQAYNQDLLTDTIIYSEGEEFRNEKFYNVILGTDYHINDRNVITLSGNYALEMEDQPSHTDFSMADGAENVVSQWSRTEVTEATNPKYQFDLQYKRDFENHKDHELLVSATGSFFGKSQSSDFLDETVAGTENQNAQQKTETTFDEGKYTFKLDYTKPFSEGFTLETGGQYLLNNVGNDYAVRNLENGVYVIDSTQTNDFEYNQDVLGVYGTVAYEKKNWGLKLGLRVENTELNTLLANTGEKNHQNYTNLFPTVHTSYKVKENISLQAGYSRRIYRPRLWDLNPFFNIRNNFNIRQGNPDLLPEFTDSFELGAVYNKNTLSLSSSLYHRYTTSVIERISFFENNVNTTRPENIGTNNATGLEVNAQYEPLKWLTFNADFNYNYFVRNGELETTVFDFSADQWSSKLTTKLKLPRDFDLEFTGRYRSAYETVQGHVSDRAFLDMGARKKILDGKGVINMSVRDVFASRIEETIVSQPDYNLYTRSLRGRFVTLGFSYGFGKGEAMTYSGRRR